MTDEHHNNHANHDADEHHASERDRAGLNVPVIVTVGLLSVLLLTVIAIGTQAWYYYEANQVRQERIIEATNSEVAQLENEARAKLRGEQWTDADGNTHEAMPIDRAMQRIVESYQGTADAQDELVPATQAAATQQPATQTEPGDNATGPDATSPGTDQTDQTDQDDAENSGDAGQTQ